MERKIGEIFEYEGEWYQCVEGRGCKSCGFYEKGQQCKAVYYAVGSCGTSRSDKRPVLFKKLEKVGAPYPLYGHIVQRYAGITSPFFLPREPYACFNLSNNTIDIEVKQNKQNTEYMETNEKTMPVPDGWEFDRIDECGNIVLKEKKKELPKTFDKCWNIIETENLSNFSIETTVPDGMVKPMRALCQLLVCRNAWWKQLGWKPDWMDNKTRKHCIHSDSWSTCDITQHSTYPRILAFPNAETAKDFLDTFKDLIEEAKELL